MKAIGKITSNGIKGLIIRTLAILIVIPILILGIYSYIVARNNLIE